MAEKMTFDPTSPLRPIVPAYKPPSNPTDAAAQAEVERKLATLGDPDSAESRALVEGRRSPTDIAIATAEWLAGGPMPTPEKFGPEVESQALRYGRGAPKPDDEGNPYAGNERPEAIATRVAQAAADAKGKPGKLGLRRYSKDSPSPVGAPRACDEYEARRLREFYSTRVNV